MAQYLLLSPFQVQGLNDSASPIAAEAVLIRNGEYAGQFALPADGLSPSPDEATERFLGSLTSIDLDPAADL